LSVIRLDKGDIAVALVAIACGGYALLVAAEVVPVDMADNTPRWIAGLVGGTFVVAGLMVFLRNYSRALDLMAALLLAAFTLLAAWVAVYGAEEVSGGVPFLPRDMNVSIGRVMFGMGAVMCFGGFLYAVQRFFDSHK
jgi:hypothetical protein